MGGGRDGRSVGGGRRGWRECTGGGGADGGSVEGEEGMEVELWRGVVITLTDDLWATSTILAHSFTALQ